MSAAETTPTGGYGNAEAPRGNGHQEVSISGWGASLAAKGTNVVALVVLIAGMMALGATNWYALRLMRDEIHEHMLTVDAKAAAQSQAKLEMSEEHKFLVAAVREAVEAVQAYVWVVAQDEKTRRQLALPEPAGIRALRRPNQGAEQDVPIRGVPKGK